MSEMFSVQIRDGRLRARPSFLGKITGPVAYGDRVAVAARRGAWWRVATQDGREGWLHQSALTSKTIQLKAGTRDVRTGATEDELALAGKGFNSQVEAAYRRRHPGLDYTRLDRMAADRVSPEQMTAFLIEGELEPEGGRQ